MIVYIILRLAFTGSRVNISMWQRRNGDLYDRNDKRAENFVIYYEEYK